ncbi:DUF6702 family protein [Hugenholtzia roseola]|uniref:DUF6702 family protein n=1 Tax=Hugenholtzia roseola TaxID=1002 RepID=UPI0012B5B516|nr:DUF6702 family protein [Hugenholtzia roseola]
MILSPQKTGAVASLTNIRKTKPIRAAVLHPIHISVTEMEYQAAQKTIEVSHKIFIDDLEAILEKRFRKKFRLTLEGKAEQSSYIYDYLRQNFKLSLPASSKQKNEKESLLQAHFLGYEFDFEAIYIYAEYKSVKSFNQIKIENRILLDLFADQKNITHLRYGQVEKSSLLRTGKVEEVLEF